MAIDEKVFPTEAAGTWAAGAKAMARAKVTVTINGKEYVAIPRADYLRMVGGKDLEGAVDAVEYTRRSLGKSLRAARETARLTQDDLAQRLGKTQPMVSGAESGTVRVGPRYVAAVLKACGLPKDWKPVRGKKS